MKFRSRNYIFYVEIVKEAILFKLPFKGKYERGITRRFLFPKDSKRFFRL